MSAPSEGCIACKAPIASERCDRCGAVSRAGAYRVESVIAQTPHSRVYVARDEAGRRVALKELLFAAVPGTSQLEAFNREGRLLQELDHPQIPKFLASFQVGEGAGTRLYLAQELVEGESLAARLASGALSEKEAKDVATQVLNVLAYLHGRTPRIVHRDIKPHNLIRRADGTLLLVDFGAARELQSGVTHQSTLVGTYGYMPPDQLAGTVEPSSDLYALGATLLHLITGTPPDKLLGDDLQLGAGVTLHVSSAFNRFIRRLVEKAPGRRFADAAAALEGLGAKTSRTPMFAAVGAMVLIAAGAAVVWKTRSSPPPPVPAAAPAVTVWVWEMETPLFEAANVGSVRPRSFALPFGTELKVDGPPANQADSFLKLLPPRSGYVQTSAVSLTEPNYTTLLDAARTALAEARLIDVEREGERARLLRPREREPHVLLAALYNAQSRADDARRIEVLLKELGPAPATPTPPVGDARVGAEPVAGQTWFVSANVLRLRRTAAADGKVLAELPINTELEIVSVRGEWAQVRWSRGQMPSTLDFSLDDSTPNPQPLEKSVEGWLAHAYLAPAKVELGWTLSKADAAQTRNDLPDLVRQLGRAAAINPVDRPLRLRLAKAAVDARDYPPAARAAVAAHELSSGSASPLVELTLAYRCRGQRARAEMIDDSREVARMPADACIVALEQASCPPTNCDCGIEEPQAEATPGCSDEDPCMDGQCVDGMCRTGLCVPSHGNDGVYCSDGQRCIDGECRSPEPEKTEYELWEEGERERTDKLSAIDGAFDGPSWLRVKVTGPSRADPSMSRVIVYHLTSEETRTQDLTDDGEDSSQCESLQAHVKAIDTVPMPAAGQDITIWIRVPQYDGALYGVAFGPSADHVAGELEEQFSGCGSGFPGNSIQTAENSCPVEHCQCT